MTTGDLVPEGQHASSATQKQRRQLCFQPNNFKFLAVVPVIVAVLALSFSVAAQDHRCKVIDLGTLGGLKSGEVLPGGNINNRAEAIAVSETSAGDPYFPNCFTDCSVAPSIKRDKGLVNVLRTPANIDGRENSSLAIWLANTGWTVGLSENALLDPFTGFPKFTTVSWRKHGTVLDPGALGRLPSQTFSVSDLGRIGGVALNNMPDGFALFMNGMTVATRAHAFLWQGRSMEDLGTAGGADSNAQAIHDHGKGVGTHTDSSPNSFNGIFSVPSIAQKSQEAATSISEITISVHDYADVPPFRLAAAEASARRIFGLAGVKTEWLSCSPKLEESEPADCSTVDATHLVLKILSGKTTANVRYRDDVLGNVLLTDDAVSYFAYAFFDHIEMLEQRLNSPVLGYVLAHEIGHLLLGSNTHSVSGIMSPHWNGPELLRISEGNLFFLPNECQKLRKRLGLRKVEHRTGTMTSFVPGHD